ncbi:unnamed protein product [Symbiodinium sp. CCMP2456]|nr:unnamed protein product [Symbiodinium sp. CCMP2456]
MPPVCDHGRLPGSKSCHGKTIAGFLLTAYARRDRTYNSEGFVNGEKRSWTSDGSKPMILLKQKDGQISSYTNKGPCSSNCSKTCGVHNHRFIDGSTGIKHRGLYTNRCLGIKGRKHPDKGATQRASSMPGRAAPNVTESKADEQRSDTQPCRRQTEKQPHKGATQRASSMPGKAPPTADKSTADEQRSDTQPCQSKMLEELVDCFGSGVQRAVTVNSESLHPTLASKQAALQDGLKLVYETGGRALADKGPQAILEKAVTDAVPASLREAVMSEAAEAFCNAEGLASERSCSAGESLLKRACQAGLDKAGVPLAVDRFINESTCKGLELAGGSKISAGIREKAGEAVLQDGTAVCQHQTEKGIQFRVGGGTALDVCVGTHVPVLSELASAVGLSGNVGKTERVETHTKSSQLSSSSSSTHETMDGIAGGMDILGVEMLNLDTGVSNKQLLKEESSLTSSTKEQTSSVSLKLLGKEVHSVSFSEVSDYERTGIFESKQVHTQTSSWNVMGAKVHSQEHLRHEERRSFTGSSTRTQDNRNGILTETEGYGVFGMNILEVKKTTVQDVATVPSKSERLGKEPVPEVVGAKIQENPHSFKQECQPSEACSRSG